MARRPRTAPNRAVARGFTLVELLVAMAAGLVVSMAALLLSKNATKFFQHEARISSAQLAATLGISRLTADLQRAAFLSSPNVLKDPLICGTPVAWPAGMRRLASVTIKRGASNIDHPGQLAQSLANGFDPDALIIGGSFDTTEQFYFNSLTCGGGGCDINLDPYSGAMKRTLQRAAGGGEALADIFAVGRLLRIKLLGQSKTMYGIIRGVVTAGSPLTDVTVQVAAAPALPTLAAQGDCGVNIGFNGNGGFVNPVSRIRYDLRSLVGDASYGPVVAPISPEVTGDNGRTELVRVELDANNNEIPGTLELVAEYAVDLKFGISVVTYGPVPTITNPTLTRYPITMPVDNANVYTFADEITNLGAAPERIRAVQARLATRTRAPDRVADLRTRDPDGDRLRFLLPGILPGVLTQTDAIPPGAPPIFARMRTVYADVSLPNQSGVSW